MAVTLRLSYRAPLIGAAAAALLVGAFTLGTANSGSATAAAGGPSGGSTGTGAVLTSSSGSVGKLTVSGTGTVTGTPRQLILSMGVQVNSSSVSSALTQANQATRRVIAALKARGVAAGDIATSGLSIQPNYRAGSQAPIGYGVSEQLTATLRDLARAGTQIQEAVAAGGNATTVDGIQLNLSDSSELLARARAAAIKDAQAKAAQFARALGEHITAVISVSDQSQSSPFPLFNSAQGSPARASVPVQPGTQQVSVQITVVYALG